MTQALIDLDPLRAMLGPHGLLTEAGDVAPFLEDWRALYHGSALAVARPASVEDVAMVVRFCAEREIGVVPQGGNTSLVGGATPPVQGQHIVVSLSRMNRVREIDPVGLTIVLEAGMTLKAAQDEAEAAGCLLPISIASEGSAVIGGVLAVNAGGANTLRYGNARDLVLGLEAVMPDGSIWHGLRKLRKDNTGYCLRQLLVGSEGTLGIITAAVMKLMPSPRQIETVLCAAPSVDAILGLFRRLQAYDPAALHAFEYMSGLGLSLVLKHIEGTVLPLAEEAPHYALIELATPRGGSDLRAGLETVLEAALEAGEITDAAIAESQQQRRNLWVIREEHTEAHKREGATIKNDVSVAIADVPQLLRQSEIVCEELIPGIRAVPFGHIGDGNIHLNLLQPAGGDGREFMTYAGQIMGAVNEIVRRMDGSFSAEHGIGQMKIDMLADWRGGAEWDAMRRIKSALDPANIMNPGKMLPAAG